MVLEKLLANITLFALEERYDFFTRHRNICCRMDQLVDNKAEGLCRLLFLGKETLSTNKFMDGGMFVLWLIPQYAIETPGDETEWESVLSFMNDNFYQIESQAWREEKDYYRNIQKTIEVDPDTRDWRDFLRILREAKDESGQMPAYEKRAFAEGIMYAMEFIRRAEAGSEWPEIVIA
jgi:hypothetical protein